jgi:hypothetical protein
MPLLMTGSNHLTTKSTKIRSKVSAVANVRNGSKADIPPAQCWAQTILI